jgi:predicted PurR-regulated permease PerM
LTARIETKGVRALGGVVPLRFVVGALVFVGAVTIAPLWAPIVLAAWTAQLLEPLAVRWGSRLGGRGRAALALTALVVVLILVPLVLLGVSLAAAAVDVLAQLRASKQTSALASSFLPSGIGPSLEHLSPQRILDFAKGHGDQAFAIATAALGGLTAVALGLVMYVFSVYECVAHGPRFGRWLRERSFVPKHAFDRLGKAFFETGRGLIVGIGGTALLQGTVATIGYAIVGVPQPLLLGFVTLVASLIPSSGTALIWVPLTVILFATGNTTGGIVLALFGCVAAVIDNLFAPWLSRYGKFQLPTYVTLVAMIGGIVVFGGFGLILGPLFVRLAVEALDLWRERHADVTA